MHKINFLAPIENNGGNTNANPHTGPKNQANPELQLLKDLFPGRAAISVQEACEVLNVSEDFLYIRLNNGSIRGIKNGRNWAIPLTEVARLLREGIK